LNERKNKEAEMSQSLKRLDKVVMDMVVPLEF